MKVNWGKVLEYLVIGAVVVSAAIALFFWMAAEKWEDRYHELNGEYKSEKRQYEDISVGEAYIREGLRESLKAERLKRAEDDKRIEELKVEKEVLADKLSKAKKEIEVAPSNYIVVEIGKRIGEEEIRFTLSGSFDITRTGANRTLFRFVEGETAQGNYEKELLITARWQVKGVSYEKDLVTLGEERDSWMTQWDGCDDALQACDRAKLSLEKAYSRQKWASFLKGAGTVLGILGVVKILK